MNSRKFAKNFLFVFIAGIMLPALTVSASESKKSGGGKHSASGKGKAHWAYAGSEGPGRWGTRDTGYATCRTGAEQSPIDIKGGFKDASKPLKFSYRGTKLSVLNNGHTIQVNYGVGNVLEVQGEKFRLAQFHFHSPSEHKVKGSPYDMEMHLVHLNRKKQLAVVGVLLKAGRESPILKKIWRRMPTDANVKIEEVGSKISVADLLPGNKSYYNYSGSLTTPPCSEGVRWFVLITPVEVSRTQIRKFVPVVGKNARPVQRINKRALFASK